MKKVLDTIKKIGNHEKRIVNDIILKISREIVNNTLDTNTIIILGNVTYLRKRKQRLYQMRMARLLSGFPYYKLTEYIKY